MWFSKRLVIIIVFSLPLIAEAQRQLLCLQKNAAVYYETFKLGDEVDREKWEVLLTVENQTTDNLYYIQDGKLASENPDFIPPFVTIKIINAKEKGVLADEVVYLRGAITLHIADNSSSGIFKVGTKRNEHSIKVLVKKGEGVILDGRFVADLVPLDSIKRVSFRK